jgi:iron(III) transport system permease protein
MSLIFVRLWPVAILCVATALSLPLLVISGSLLFPALEVWAHLASTVLSDYVINSLIVMVGVGIGTFILGVGPAWLTAMCCFPLHRIFEWALLLPLSMPAYIIAYTYTGMLDVAGPVQTALRDGFGWRYGDYWFPNVRSLGGAVVMLTLVLYPYVYLLARAAFLEQSICVLEVSRTLGCSAWQSFVRVALPLARPAIIAGLSLALMESLADYGTVQYFGVSTFTTGIFRTWFGLGEPAAAAQLSALLLLFVLTLIVLEQASRKRAHYHHTSHRYRPLPGYRLRGWPATVAFSACFLPLLLGFLLPTGQLLHWTLSTAAQVLDRQFVLLALHSVSLALSAALLALMLALVMAYGKRRYARLSVNVAVRFVGLGYALPGTVIAVGVMLPLAWIDNALDAWFEAHFGISTGLLLSGTLVALLFGYMVRFLAVSLGTVEAGLGKIRCNMDDAARSLGLNDMAILRWIHLPIMRGSLLTALLLVFVDVLKELPATLILRPFNFNTLAVRTYELANDERLIEAASSALAIVLCGIVPVILLSRSISRSRPGYELRP